MKRDQNERKVILSIFKGVRPVGRWRRALHNDHTRAEAEEQHCRKGHLQLLCQPNSPLIIRSRDQRKWGVHMNRPQETKLRLTSRNEALLHEKCTYVKLYQQSQESFCRGQQQELRGSS